MGLTSKRFGYQPGDRVGVIVSEDAEKVLFAGFGVYLGDRLHPAWEGAVSLYAAMYRNPDYSSEETCRAQAAGWAAINARQERGIHAKPREEEIEAEYERISVRRRRLAELDDEELRQHVRDMDSSLVRNPYIETDNGEHWWGIETWWGCEEAVRERLKRAEQAGKRIVEVTRADVGLEPQPPAD